MVEFYVLLGIAVVFSALFIAFWKPNTPHLDIFLKSLATISVISLAIVTVSSAGLNEVTILLLVGLLFCMMGDLVLALREYNIPEAENKLITMGEASFGIAQIFFIAMLAIITNLVSLWGLIFGAVFAVGMLFSRGLLKLDFGKCLVPSLAYGFLLASNVGGSLIALIMGYNSINYILLFAGFLMFIVSDLILSKIYFGGNKSVWTQKINYVFYYLAIILLASALVIF